MKGAQNCYIIGSRLNCNSCRKQANGDNVTNVSKYGLKTVELSGTKRGKYLREKIN
jgi:hypothetical protein